MYQIPAIHIRFPEVFIKPPGNNLLVFAPHPDDEVLGCGGTIRKHVLSGDRVTVVYMTDGRHGRKIKDDPMKTAERRMKESLEACSALEVHNSIHLNLPDSELVSDKTTVETVKKILAEIQPQIVYLPNPQDWHPDHRMTFYIVQKAVEELAMQLSGYVYEIWNPVSPDCLINVTDVMQDKIAALHCYQSQMEMHDYVQMIKVLNSYRILQIPDISVFFSVMKREKKERDKIGLTTVWPWKYAEVFHRVLFGKPTEGVANIVEDERMDSQSYFKSSQFV